MKRQISYWIKKEFYLVFFLIGIIVTSIGAVLFYVSINPPTYSYDPNYQGFVVARNSTVIPSNMVIGFDVGSRDMFFEYFYMVQTNGTYNFIFLFPFNVVSTNEDSGNMTINSTSTCTVISLSLYLIQYKSRQIWGSFRIANTFLSGNRGLYSIVLPFGRGINSEVFGTISQKLKVEPQSSDATIDLYVSLPSSYSYTESIPAIADMNPFVNPLTNKSTTSLHWNFNQLRNSVTIMVTDQSEINYLQNITFWSGILFGIGVSSVLNTVYDAYKVRIEKAEKHSSQGTGDFEAKA